MYACRCEAFLGPPGGLRELLELSSTRNQAEIHPKSSQIKPKSNQNQAKSAETQNQAEIQNQTCQNQAESKSKIKPKA